MLIVAANSGISGCQGASPRIHEKYALPLTDHVHVPSVKDYRRGYEHGCDATRRDVSNENWSLEVFIVENVH